MERGPDRVVAAIVAVLLLVMVLLALGIWQPVKATGGPLVATTQNVRYTLGPAHTRYDVRRAARGSDLVLLQEFSGKRASAYAPAGYGTWQAPRGQRAEAPVLWRRATLGLVSGYTVLLHRSTLFASATRYASVVRFRVRATGACLRVVNLHMIPGIDRSGYLVRAPRAALARRAVAVIAAVARGAPDCATLVGGDWNFAYHSDCRVHLASMPCARMSAAGYLAQWGALAGDRPTFGHRIIDTLWVRRSQVRPLWQSVSGGTYSDHQRVRLGFILR